jgi:O-antigen ligase
MKNLFLPKIKNLSIYELILLLFPLCQISGSFLVNFSLILSSIIFIHQSIKKNFFNQFKLNWLYFYIIFIIYTIIISFFASDILSSLRSSISQIRFLLFSLFIFLCISNVKNIERILKFWLILVLFVSADIIYQYFFSKNIFGFPIIINRPSGVFQDELVAGTFISFISLPIISYYFKKFDEEKMKYKFLYSLIYLLLFASVALTGERLAFIIFFAGSIIIFVFNTSIKKFIILSVSLIIFFIFIYFNSSSLNARVKDFNNIILNFYNSSYGRLWESSYLLFDKNKIFGVGLKNYRVDCDNQLDPRPDSVSISGQFCSSHPHNFFLEILSETGLVGFFIFFIFFAYLMFYLKDKIKSLKNDEFFKKYSSLLYGNILILLIYVWPLKTSGSFFTTWNGSFFWLNLGIALLITKGKIKN